MADFPTSLPDLSGTTYTNSTLLKDIHPNIHNSISEELDAIATKVGIDSSADTDSLDYKMINHTHVLATGAADVTASADEVNIMDGVTSTTAELNLLDGVTGTIFTNNSFNGWQELSHTWTRTGDHTFTVPTDVTATYRKGSRVRYKDGGGYEYGVITSSSYGAPNTTVTLITNTDYAMAAATITNPAISYIENPESFPLFFAFDAAPTGFASFATNSCKWTTRGGTIYIYVDVVGTSNATDFSITNPAGTSSTRVFGTVRGRNNGTYGFRLYGTSATNATASFYLDAAGSAWTNSGTKSVESGVLQAEL